MALLAPYVGEVELLKRMLYSTGNTDTTGTLKLRTDNVTPSSTDTAGTYTEATFTGYVAKTLTMTQSGATWAVPAGGVTPAFSLYGTTTTNQWLPTSSQTVTGYFIIGTTSTILWWSENFSSPKPLNNGDTLNVQPRMQMT